MNFKRMMKNTKAISPIFATLILIAIAVIAGIVVYMFTSGYLAGMAGNTATLEDKASVPGASVAADGDAQALITNMGTNTFQVTGLQLKNSQGAVIAQTTDVTVTVNGADVTTSGVIKQVTAEVGATFAAFTATPPVTLTSGEAYTITVLTSGGGSFVSAPFTA